MPVIQRSALVRYSPAQMYALVDDIESYPQFLPWCAATTVFSRSEDEVRAAIELHRGGVRKTFTTLNRLQKNKMIEVRLVEGPFHHLEGFWRFEPLGETGEGCKVTFDMNFEFSSRILGLTVGPVFNQITNTLVDAFCQRAEQIYGGS